jgi:tetratricopeptide (TPR) repeat protein
MSTQEQFCTECGAANVPTARFCQNCASLLPVTPITGSLPEQTLLDNRYQLVSRIGQGGMGAVYKAEDTKFNNRPVAIKEMSKAGLSPNRIQEAEEAFKREAELLSGLLHPNLPRIYESFTENDRSYLVMDFIEGETVEEYLEHVDGGPLPVDQVIDWAEQLCDVLSYLHNRQPPIIFRDLKPANVMISESGHIFLIDFGIARIFKPGKSHDTVAFGSPGYAAPEQYGKAQSTPRTDIYCLGTLLHQLLTGIDPTENPFFFRPASKVNSAVSPELDALLQQMLSMDADQRPASAQEVFKALRQIEAQGDQGHSSTSLKIGTDSLLQQAHMLYTQKNLDQAATLYEQALSVDSTNALAWQGLGLSRGLRSLHRDALASFERALQLDPSLVVSWNGKGTALSNLQRNQESLAAFERALQLEPNSASAWNGKGAVLNTLGKPDQALSAFDMAIRFDPKMTQSSLNKGLVLRQLGRYREALTAFEQALALDRTNAMSWSGKASILHELRRLEEALDAYGQACTYNPALVSAWSGKGSVLYDMGRSRLKDAQQAYQEALRLDKNYAPALYGLGNVLYAQQKLKRALEMFEQATKSDPKFARAWHRRGNVLSELGDRMRALDCYDQALRLDPRYASASSSKASILTQFQRYPEALNAYNYALSANPNFAHAWNGKGNVFYYLGDYPKALDAYERAVQINPRMASAWHNKSLVLKQLRLNQEALASAEEAIRLAPQDPDNWQRKAEALRQLRRRGEARKAEEQVTLLRSRMLSR